MKRSIRRSLRRLLVRTGAALALCIGAFGVSHGASVVQMPFEKLVAEAEVAFEGRVVSVESAWSESGNAIVTHVTFSVADVIVGSSHQTVQLTFLGGTVGDIRMGVSGLRVPAVGEEGVYFVESLSRRLVSPVLGWNQGQFRIAQRAGERIVLTSDGRPLAGFAEVDSSTARLNEHVPSGVRMAEEIAGAISVSAFKAHVQQLVRRAADDRQVVR